MARYCFTALFLLAALASSQEPVIRSDVRQVLVPVVVTDKAGHHILDLKATDFQILEDGRPQRIVAFGSEKSDVLPVAASRLPEAASPRHAAAPEVARDPAQSVLPRRSYLIVLDTLHGSFGDFGQVRNALAKFLKGEQPADAQYSLIAVGREARVIQNSTRDPEVVMAAVQSKHFQNLMVDSEASNIANSVQQFKSLVRAYCAACGCNGRGRAICTYPPKLAAQGFLTSFSERALLLDQEFLRQLHEVVRAAGELPGSRTVVFLSDGFNRFAGRELYGILQGYGAQDASFTFNSRDTRPELEKILKLATNSNVRFYTIDARGLYSEASLAGSDFSASSSGVSPHSVDSQIRSVARENTDVLAELAHTTGGTFFEGSNDLLRGIRQAFADGREYYLLAYVPENKAEDGRYRKIEVVARDRAWRVNAKAGYWASPQ